MAELLDDHSSHHDDHFSPQHSRGLVAFIQTRFIIIRCGGGLLSCAAEVHEVRQFIPLGFL